MKASPKLQLVVSVTEQSQRDAIVDEFGELDRQVQAFKPSLNRHKLLREKILAWFPDLPGDQASSLSGQLYDLNVTERENETHIVSMRKVYKIFGVAKFLEACSLTLKALVAQLGEDVAAKYTEKRRTGPRHLIAIPKASPAAPAKAA